MAETRLDEQRANGVLAAVSQRAGLAAQGAVRSRPHGARTYFAGDDVLICVMEDALLPAERMMVRMGDQQRVRESRTAFQAATRDQFVGTVEAIIRRRVEAFASAIDADEGVVWEVFNLEPVGAQGDGARP